MQKQILWKKTDPDDPKDVSVLTLKYRLTDITAEEDAAFETMTEAFTAACSLTSEFLFRNGLIPKKQLHNALYGQIRERYGLKSQLACSVLTHTAAAYLTVREQYKETPFTYKDKVSGKTYVFDRTLEWMTEPVQFRRRIAVLQRGRDWSFSKGLLSVQTMGKRVLAAYECEYRHPLVDDTWTYGAGTLIKRCGIWYLMVSVSKETDAKKPGPGMNVLGIDRGLINIIADSDGNTASGSHAVEVSDRYFRTRRSLQSKGTRARSVC